MECINWARIAAQVVYYFRAGLALGAPHRQVSFAVPTGNFGNVLAGYVAHRIGLPIRRLVIGSNENDILTRFFEQGAMEQGPQHSGQPSIFDQAQPQSAHDYLSHSLEPDIEMMHANAAHRALYDVKRGGNPFEIARHITENREYIFQRLCEESGLLKECRDRKIALAAVGTRAMCSRMVRRPPVTGTATTELRYGSCLQANRCPTCEAET